MNIRHCKLCDSDFGTIYAWISHKGQNGCKSSKVMNREGFWRGFSGIWWSKDGGYDDTVEGWYEAEWDDDGQPIHDTDLLPILQS